MFASSSERVYSDVPEMFDAFLRPFFLFPQHRLTGWYSKRACWDMAEMFISYLLSVGWSPYDIQRGVEDKAKNSRHTGELDPVFVKYCLKILDNLRRVGRFADFIEGYNDHGTIREKHSWCNAFLDSTLVKKYGRDSETRREMNRCDVPDRQTQEILEDMQVQLHREAERKWHLKAAEILGGDRRYQSSSLSRNPVSSPSTQVTRRVAFPYEPTMTESSMSDSWIGQQNRNMYGPSNEIRGRSTSRSTHHPQLMSPATNTQSGWGDDIRSEALTSQVRPFNDRNRDQNISRLRMTSPGGTVTILGTDGTSTIMSGPIENQSGNRLRRDSDHQYAGDLRNMYDECRMGDDHLYQPRDRSYERKSYGQEQRRGTSSMDSNYSSYTFFNRTRRESEDLCNFNSGQNETEYGREPLKNRSRSSSMSDRRGSRSEDTLGRQPRASRTDRDSRPPLAYNRDKNIERRSSPSQRALNSLSHFL